MMIAAIAVAMALMFVASGPLAGIVTPRLIERQAPHDGDRPLRVLTIRAPFDQGGASSAERFASSLQRNRSLRSG